MAVSFKIPKSPSRDVFAVDNFQGVDFSNTETSIEPTKSPNAENMVRLVPGKVRKRTGYKTQILFADDVDINRAINTSENFIEYDITGTSAADGKTLAKFYDIFPANTKFLYRCEIEYIGEYQVLFYPNTADPSMAISNTTEKPKNSVLYKTVDSPAQAVSEIRIYRTSPARDIDYFKIRKIMMCHKSAHYAQHMVWTPAPEDSGAKYINRGKIDPIYGCHILKSYDVDRVVNVNRALATSDTFETFSVTDTRTDIYALADKLYMDEDRRVNVYAEFDYISDAVVNLHVGANIGATKLSNTSGATVHYSAMVANAGGYWPGGVGLRTDVAGTTATVQIKNLSIMYEKNNSYTWKPAPEDNGGVFHIEDIYNVEANNYSAIDDYYWSGTTSSLVATTRATIGTPASHVVGYAKVTFDIETSTSEDIDHIDLQIHSNSYDVYDIVATEQLNNHYELYVTPSLPTEYIQTIFIRFTMASQDATCIAYIKNIKVQKIRLRDNYSIYARDYLYHVGKEFYIHSSVDDQITKVYSDANQHRSQSWQLDDKLAIVDGKNLYVYQTGQGLQVVSNSNAYIPTVTKAKTPSGGGTSYDALNMVQAGFYEEFMVQSATATTKDFYLSFTNLDATTTKAWWRVGGTWVEKREGVDYSVNRILSLFRFNSAPGASVDLDSQDNVRILAYRTVDGYKDRVTKCTTGALFGVGGKADRLFLSGNPDHPNWDFYSGEFDPTYFPDTGYSVLGSAASSVVGYAIVNNYLAAFKDEHDPAQNVIIREGGSITIDGLEQPAFKIVNTLQGNGVIAPYSFAYLQTEPLFLTRSGICAITPLDITGERYSQNRSFYLNGKLTKEEGLEDAVATIFNDQYVLALNRQLYILDGLQSLRTDKSMPYSTRQYAGFYCTSVPASCIWSADGALWVGTFGGKICKFATDTEDLDSYNDDGEAIYCCWETPDLDGQLFYKNKTFRYFAVRIMNALRTSVKLYYKRPSTIEEGGETKQLAWTLIKSDAAAGSLFDFELIDFERFTFNTDASAKVSHSKIRVKKVDKMQFKVENDAKNEPFGLYDLALEFIESGNYKG